MSSKHIQSMNEYYINDKLIINATISRSIMPKT